MPTPRSLVVDAETNEQQPLIGPREPEAGDSHKAPAVSDNHSQPAPKASMAIKPHLFKALVAYLVFVALAYITMGGFYADGKKQGTKAGDDFVKTIGNLLPHLLKTAYAQANFAIFANAVGLGAGLTTFAASAIKDRCAAAKTEEHNPSIQPQV